MKFIVFSILIAFFISLFGQDSTTVSKNDKKIFIGINVSPDFNYRILNNNDGSATSEAIINSRNDMEKAKIGYSLGLNFNYKFNKKFSLGTGLQFSNKGYKSFATGFTFGNLVDPRQGFVITSTDPAIPKNATFINNFYYLEVPLRSILTLGSKKIRFIASLGFTTNFLIKTSTTTVSEFNNGSTKKSTQPTIETYNSVNISPSVSMGMEMKVKNRSFIRIEPTFRYGLLNIINAPITAKLWNVGLNISYYFGLK